MAVQMHALRGVPWKGASRTSLRVRRKPNQQCSAQTKNSAIRRRQTWKGTWQVGVCLRATPMNGPTRQPKLKPFFSREDPRKRHLPQLDV